MKKTLATLAAILTAAMLIGCASTKEEAAPVAAASGNGTPVNAPVAGTFLKACVAEGASVNADTTVVIIESMKMELEIKAGVAGKVHFVAATGSQLAQGQTVAEIQ